MTTTHAAALARLDGARAAHMDPAVAAMVSGALHRHPTTCGLRHVIGNPECRAYDDALRVLGVTS